MSVQNSGNISTVSFMRDESPSAVTRTNETIAQNGSRSGALAPYTLMSKVASSGKWVPFTDNTATDGSAVPQGVYIGNEITEAAIKAGDIEGVEIAVGNFIYTKDLLVIENSKDLDTVITGGTLTFDAGTGDSSASLANTIVLTVRDVLAFRGIFDNDSIDITAYEA